MYKCIIYHVGNCRLRYALKPIVDWTSRIHIYIYIIDLTSKPFLFFKVLNDSDNVIVIYNTIPIYICA